jgi:hypothetical protein
LLQAATFAEQTGIVDLLQKEGAQFLERTVRDKGDYPLPA